MFGYVIRKIRESKSLSQEYMAMQLNITQAAYSKLESDKTHLSIKKLTEISRLLGIKESDILNNDIRAFDLPDAPSKAEKSMSSEDYIRFLKKMLEMYEKDNIHLRLTNERLLNIIESKKAF